MLYYWLVADVGQCGVIIICIYDAGEIMPYTAMTWTHFFVWQPFGQYACDGIVEKQAHGDKYEKLDR